ncbi:MAG: hypothetical protein WDM81_19020 [Rhizomicrobium sp.]
MRLPILAFVAFLVCTPTAQAAPTCQDRIGDTIRCGDPAAMPVGWTPAQRFLLAKKNAAPDDTAEAVKAAVFIALFLALIALLPEFDGTKATDWTGRRTTSHDFFLPRVYGGFVATACKGRVSDSEPGRVPSEPFASEAEGARRPAQPPDSTIARQIPSSTPSRFL